MDKVFEAILINLFSSALWELRTVVTPSTLRQARGSAPLAAAVASATEELARRVGSRLPQGVAAVLEAPETCAIVRGLYLHRVDERDITPRAALNAFRAVCRSVPDFPSSIRPDDIFNVLVGACDRSLGAAIDNGSLLALDTRAALRHKMLGEQLEAIECLIAPPTFTADALAEFTLQLRSEVAHRTSYITPPDFYGAPRLAMNRLYVDPLLSRQREKGSGSTITLTDWLATLRNGVILGNPGAGKSSLSIRVCHEVATAPDPVLGGRERLPFIVKLRDYSAAKRERPLSLADFIAEEIHTSLQLPHVPTIVEHLLLRGSMFVAFDGLDELLDANHRQDIRDEVESFSRRYPNTFLLVTSREVGYPLAALDDDRFTVAWLNDFDRPRVERYAQKWFALDDELSPDERDAKTEAFLRESETVSDVRSNPLMLALMCNLYRGQGYIPRNRPEVYEKCATMLFDVWDRRRAIKVYLPISGHVEPAMNDLARWIYEDEVRQTGVTESQLIERTTAYLHTWRFTDVHKARKAARSFVEFCRGRAWVFTDTGTTGDGEALYQFTHRTFLEYFAARQLVASHDTLTALVGDVLPHVARGEWDVVAQLAFQIKARSSEGGADALFVGVLEYLAAAGADEALNIAAFLCQCLGFMFPRPATVARVAQEVTNNLCERGTTVERWLDVQAVAMTASEENRDAVRDGVDQVIAEGIAEGRQAAVELLLGLHAVIPLSRRSSEDMSAVSFWDRARKHLVNKYRAEIAAAVHEDMTLASLACGTRLVGLEDHVKRYGLQAAVVPRLGVIWRAGYRLDLQHILARATLGAHRSWVKNVDLAYLSDLMLSAHRPWIPADAAVQAGDGDQLGAFDVRRKYRSDHAAEVFVGFCLTAVVQELWPRSSWLSSSGALGSVVSNRGRPREFGVTIELQKMEQILREEQFAFVEAWLKGEIALVAR